MVTSDTANASTRRLDALLVAGALWSWAATGAYFWNLAGSNSVVLPYAPRIIWAAPGELWSLAPAAFVAVVFLPPILFRVLETRGAISLHAARPYAIALLAVTCVAALLWGSALIRAL